MIVWLSSVCEHGVNIGVLQSMGLAVARVVCGVRLVDIKSDD